MPTGKLVIGIDPGSSKCGVVLVERPTAGELKLLRREIVPTEQLEAALRAIPEFEQVTMIIIGNGTSSAPIVERVKALRLSLGVMVVNERNTTLEARAKYWIYNPRRGWRRLLPASMQTPPEPYDDFAALVLVERVFAS